MTSSGALTPRQCWRRPRTRIIEAGILISLAPLAPGPETRSYMSAVVNAVEAAAAATGGAVVPATASVEVSAGGWERALSLATVEPQTRRPAPLTPSLLPMVGRALCRASQIVFDLEGDRRPPADAAGERCARHPSGAATAGAGSTPSQSMAPAPRTLHMIA